MIGMNVKVKEKIEGWLTTLKKFNPTFHVSNRNSKNILSHSRKIRK